MAIITAIIIYVSIIISFIQNWLLLTVVLVGIFSFRFGAAALIPMVILLDSYFGNFYGVPYLSIFAVIWYAVVGFIQPKLINFKV